MRNKRKERSNRERRDLRCCRTINSAIVRVRPKGNRRLLRTLLRANSSSLQSQESHLQCEILMSTSSFGGNRAEGEEANQTLGFINSVCDLDPSLSPPLTTKLPPPCRHVASPLSSARHVSSPSVRPSGGGLMLIASVSFCFFGPPSSASVRPPPPRDAAGTLWSLPG